MNLWLAGGKVGERDRLGVWDWHVHTAIIKMLFYGREKKQRKASFSWSLSEVVHCFIEYLLQSSKGNVITPVSQLKVLRLGEVKQDHQPTRGSTYIKSYFHPSQAKSPCRLTGKTADMWPHSSDKEQASTAQASMRASSLALVAKGRASRIMADATDWSCEWVQLKQCSSFPCVLGPELEAREMEGGAEARKEA